MSYNERKRGDLPLFRQKVVVEVVTAEELPRIEGVSPEVAALLPQIARLNPIGLHALKRLPITFFTVTCFPALTSPDQVKSGP